jgi:hypothetical protein
LLHREAIDNMQRINVLAEQLSPRSRKVRSFDNSILPSCMARSFDQAQYAILNLNLQAKVAVLGAAGGIGQPLSMLLKMSPLIGELSLYDVAATPGVACDLSHMSTPAVVKGYLGPDQLPAALQGCQLVVIPAGERLCS